MWSNYREEENYLLPSDSDEEDEEEASFCSPVDKRLSFTNKRSLPRHVDKLILEWIASPGKFGPFYRCCERRKDVLGEKKSELRTAVRHRHTYLCRKQKNHPSEFASTLEEHGILTTSSSTTAASSTTSRPLSTPPKKASRSSLSSRLSAQSPAKATPPKPTRTKPSNDDIGGSGVFARAQRVHFGDVIILFSRTLLYCRVRLL